jgi:Protein of unknown function (DUF664)
LMRKVVGISDADARRTPTASALSLLGLIKHSAAWEGRWFQVVVAGRALPDGWPERVPEESDEDFLISEDDTIPLWLAVYRQAIAVSREIAAGIDLGQPCARGDIAQVNLRWVLLHMIEETARHAGHADIIRETLDGQRGI